jgi:dTDP-4-dehydrorhamnose 3,5-epimerase
MNVHATSLPGVLVVELDVHRDPRGTFIETFHAARYAGHGIAATFVQDAISRSIRHAVRGLHFQEPHAQGKLVGVLRGAIFDVAVDVRCGSPTFGAWYGVELSEDNRKQLWIPGGFAHGFLALSELADVSYKLTAAHDASAARRIRWNDPALAIRWPLVGDPLLSEADAGAPLLADAPILPTYEAAP